MQIPEPNLRRYIALLQPEWPILASSLSEALSTIAAREVLSPKSLATLEEAASSERTAVYELASYLIGSASVYETQAQDLIRDLSIARKAHIRHNAILCLARETPPSVTLEVITRTLFDKSSRVRNKAADWALRLKLSAAIPILEKAITAEAHAVTLSAMTFSLDLMRDGYRLEPVDERRVRITFETGYQLTSEIVDKSIIAQRGISAVVVGLRST